MIRTLSFKVTATIIKIETVEIDDEGLTTDEIIDAGEEAVHQQFTAACDVKEEDYEEETAYLGG